MDRVPCVIHEDDHLLVVHKPPGWNTHSPDPYANEGIYEWLRYRRPEWQGLAIVHRLDRETSGVMVFPKTTTANRSLTQQWEQHGVRKRYRLLTDRQPQTGEWVARGLQQTGAKKAQSDPAAETRFWVVKRETEPLHVLAEPTTGRTHQIRIHAAESGIPILGDEIYGGASASRLCLHAESIAFHHPGDNEWVTFEVPANFDEPGWQARRAAVIDPETATAYRWVHGVADGWPGLYLDRIGDWLLSHSSHSLTETERDFVRQCVQKFHAKGSYHKSRRRDVGHVDASVAAPTLIEGAPTTEHVTVLENGVTYAASLQEGYSIGLFCDQRDNRRRVLTQNAGGDFVFFDDGLRGKHALNLFAYTCAFSVCAALAGATVTSQDLSSKYLEWGKTNFRLNGLDPEAHDFIYGDALNWLPRLARKGRCFDLILIDPPTFSKSKGRKVFQIARDLPALVEMALAVLTREGILFVSSNAWKLPADQFLRAIDEGFRRAGRTVGKRRYFPQPPDFPISKGEPAYLKTVWLRADR